MGILVDNDGNDGGGFGVFVGRDGAPALVVADVGGGVQTRMAGDVTIEGNLTVDGSIQNSSSTTNAVRAAGAPSQAVALAHPTRTGETLRHAALLGTEPLSVYSGTVQLGADGTALVRLPELRYVLTPVGAAMPRLHVATRVADGRFRVGGGVPGGQVSWQVTARRAAANR